MIGVDDMVAALSGKTHGAIPASFPTGSKESFSRWIIKENRCRPGGAGQLELKQIVESGIIITQGTWKPSPLSGQHRMPDLPRVVSINAHDEPPGHHDKKPWIHEQRKLLGRDG